MTEDRFMTVEQLTKAGIEPEKLLNPDRPIDITPERAFCPRHGGPFESLWPQGYEQAASFLLGSDWHVGDEIPDEGAVDYVHDLLDLRPLCERVSKTTLMAAYVFSDIGVTRRCEICRQVSLGTPYTTKRADGIMLFKHVCFTCVLYNMTPAN